MYEKKFLKKKRENLKCVYNQGKKRITEQFGRNMYQDVSGNIKLFLEEMGKVDGVESKIITPKKLELGDW